MFVSQCLNTNENNHLTIGGCDTVELAKEFGTSLIVYDENEIRNNCRAFVCSIQKNYNGNGRVLYASKAFSCKEIYRIVNDENMGIDVVSGGELYTALSVGFPAEKICFHGNNKKYSELVEAVDAGVGRIVVDNLTELETLNTIAGDKGKKVSIMFRIKPGIDAHTHDFVRTGQIDSKFGLALETGEAMQGVKTALSMPNVELKGVHCHIGSQIFDIDPFELAAEVMMKFIKDIKDETGVTITELNLGGGFGIKYLVDDKPEAYENYMDNVAKVVNAKADEYGLPVPFIYIEPGRSIVGATAVTLYTVGSVKKIPDVRNYVSVDGGMVDNPRYILYQSAYEVVCANKINDDKTLTATVAGKCCESGDLIQENVKLPEVEAGDILAVLSTGAYNYSMASNYNRIPRPPVVMVKDGKARLIIKGESYEDIIKNDI
ncbi:MAG: diaminopimelate decarboxylase [Clostridia bacterium]|nr:diaminopimelate decarboxylase [Clostridia bacterium]